MVTLGFTDFFEYVDGVRPADWSHILGQDDFTKETDVAFTSDAKCQKPSTVDFSLIGWDASGSGDDVAQEIYSRFRMLNNSGRKEIEFCLNQVPDVGGGIGVPDLVARVSVTFNQVDILRSLGNGISFDPPFNIVVNTFYKIRFRQEVANEKVFLKFWQDADPEPVAWDIDGVAYADEGERGPVGFGGFPTCTHEVDVFGFATGGTTAPTAPIWAQDAEPVGSWTPDTEPAGSWVQD